MTPDQKAHAAAIVASDLWEEHLKPFLQDIGIDYLRPIEDNPLITIDEVRRVQGKVEVISFLAMLPDELKREDAEAAKDKATQEAKEAKNAGRIRTIEPTAGRTVVDIHGRRPAE